MINQKYKLYLNKKQEEKLLMYQSVCKLVWNLALNQREDYWQKARNFGTESYAGVYKYISEYEQSSDLTKLKKENSFLYDVPAGTLANVLTMLDASYKMFFRNLKKNPSMAGKPRYKGRKDTIGLKFKDWKNYPVELLDGKNYARIGLPKIGTVRFRLHNKILGKIKNCMVKRETDGWYITLAVDHEIRNENTSNSIIGIDVGVKHTITLSDGTHIDIPRHLYKMNDRVIFLQKRLGKKKRNSSNYKKLIKRIALIQSKIARSKDYFIKLTVNDLTRKNKIIAVEKLNIRSMTKSNKGTLDSPGQNVKGKNKLNQKILMNNWGAFFAKLEEMGLKNGCKIIKVNPKHTSQRCSCCGTISKENRKSQEIFNCISCNFKENAGINAAINIKHLALAGEVPVEMPSLDGSMKQECFTKKQKRSKHIEVLTDIG